MRYGETKQRPNGDVVNVVSVVFAAGDGDEGCAEEGRKSEEDASEVCAGTVDVALACEEEGEVAEAAEGEATMAAWETAPAVVKSMVVCFGADFVRDELVGGGARRGFAAGDEVGAGAADGVLDYVGDEAGEDEADD